jgi:hypothetical protein
VDLLLSCGGKGEGEEDEEDQGTGH